MTENKRYDVIYEKEPKGQVVTDEGIPCTARTCCTRLNCLTEENKELKHENVNIMSDLDYYLVKSRSCEKGLFEKDRQIAKLEKENQYIKNTIKEMLDNERTEIGKSVLKQLWEIIQ